MHIFTGTTETRMLAWAIVLGLVHVAIAAVMATKDSGVAYNMSARDTPAPPVTATTARLQRASKNFLETFGFFAAAVLLVTALGTQSAMTALGAQIYFWARLVYLPVYAAGIPVLRSLVWTVSIVGLIMVLAAAL